MDSTSDPASSAASSASAASQASTFASGFNAALSMFTDTGAASIGSLDDSAALLSLFDAMCELPPSRLDKAGILSGGRLIKTHASPDVWSPAVARRFGEVLKVLKGEAAQGGEGGSGGGGGAGGVGAGGGEGKANDGGEDVGPDHDLKANSPPSAFGEVLYPLVGARLALMGPPSRLDMCGKVTGMLLDAYHVQSYRGSGWQASADNNALLLGLVNSPLKLAVKIGECLATCDEHKRKQAGRRGGEASW